jgi:hypothetical protein
MENNEVNKVNPVHQVLCHCAASASPGYHDLQEGA